MDIGEIISDALVYPFQNIKALVIYVILGIIAGIAAGGTIFGILLGAENGNILATGGSAIIGIIVLIVVGLLISGYTLDIVKYGIKRYHDSPGIEIGRQLTNAIKLLIVGIVYYIIPVIISWILGFIFQNWLASVISFILMIIFTLAEFMAKCRLAKSDSLGEALAVGDAIGDISRVGIVKLVVTIIIIALIMAVIIFVLGFITNYNSTIGGLLLGIFGVYAVFFYNRAVGLLYSDV